MTGGAIIVVGFLLALMGRLFWRQIVAVAALLVLVVLFVGILTLVVQGYGAMNGG